MSALAPCDVEGALAQEGRIADTMPERLTLRVQSVAKQKCVHSCRERRGGGAAGVDSVSHGAGSSEIGEELEAQADDEVPDVSGHL